MNLFINTDTRQAVLGVGNLSPVSTGQTVKVLDTPGLNIYLLSGAVALDLGLSPFIKFELIAKTDTDASDPLVYDTTFNRVYDVNNNACYQGLPQFHTTNVMAALGENVSVDCLAEVRYQLASGEIARSLDIPMTLMRAIIPESGTPEPTLIPGYPDASMLVLTTSAGEPLGYATLDSSGKVPVGQIPSIPLNLTDFQTALGVSVIQAAIGIFNRLIAGTGIAFDTTTVPGAIVISSTITSGGTTMALTDAETSVGATLISDAAGILKRLAAGTGIALDTGTTPGAIIINTTGVEALSDFETSTGTSLIHTVTGILQRLVAGTGITFDTTTTPGAIILNVTGGGGALTDFETSLGVSLIHTSPFVLNRLFAGTGITFDLSTTPGAIIINASGSGSGDMTKAVYDTANRGYVDRAVLADSASAAAGGSALAASIAAAITTAESVAEGVAASALSAAIAAAGGGGGSAIYARVSLAAGGPFVTYTDGAALAWDTVLEDATGMWSSGNPSILTIATAGLYLVSASFGLDFNPAGDCTVCIGVNEQRQRIVD